MADNPRPRRWRLAALWALAAALLLAGPASAALDLPWLSSAGVNPAKVTVRLQQILAMSPQDAAREVIWLKTAQQRAVQEGRHATALLRAAAFERAGDTISAIQAYRDLAQHSGGTPYSATAEFRLGLLLDPAKSEQLHEKAIKQAGREAWYMVGGTWQLTSARSAGIQTLSALRAKRPSYRLLKFLWTISPLSSAYRYLFILFALALVSKLLLTPLHYRIATAPYQEAGPYMLAVVGLDLVLILWVIIAMVGFTPQLLLGGAKFLWLSDVTRFSWSIAIITLIVVAIVEASFYHEDFADLEPGQVALIAIGVGLVALLLGWICGCPAYVFLLWLMLRLMGGALSRSLYAYNQ